MEIGLVTPPVGLNLFVASGITGQPLMTVVRAALPWLMVLLGFLIVVTSIPEVSPWLPNLLFGNRFDAAEKRMHVLVLIP